MDHRAVFADFLIVDDGFTCVCYRVAERVVPVVVEIVIIIRTGVLNLIRLRKAVPVPFAATVGSSVFKR